MKMHMPTLVAFLVNLLVMAALPPHAVARKPQPVTDAANVVWHRAKPVTAPLPPEVRAAVRSFNVRTVPYWSFTFVHGQEEYGPEYAVGKSVTSNGGTAVVNVPIIPVRLRFPAYADPQTGSAPEIDASGDAALVAASPNFVASQYASGFTQYQDAAQRASFYGYYPDTWHTLLAPAVLPTVTIDVPDDKGLLFYFIDTGNLLAEIDYGWWQEQQARVIAAYQIPAEKLPIVLTHNALTFVGDPDSGCCIWAWHKSYVSQRGNTRSIQTAIWSNWFTADFGEIADVYSLTHEIAEWMNDPFGINLVPRWDFPQGPDFYYLPGVCANVFETTLLEVADPLENFAHSYPVTLHGFTYHLALQALVPWFTRDVPSSALHGAYSFPDESALTGPALDCP